MPDHKRVEAAVFDVDGTILDSREYIGQAFQHSLRHHGIYDVTPAAIAALVGLPLQECYRRLAPDVSFESLRGAHREFHQDHPELLVAYANALETLRALGEKGLKLAVFSSHGPAVVANIQRLELDYFDTYVHGESVEKHKPDPEGFIRATTDMAVEPRRALMIGDAAVDVQAGKAGGALATVGIAHGFGTVEDLRAAGADFIINNLPEVIDIVDDLEKNR